MSGQISDQIVAVDHKATPAEVLEAFNSVLPKALRLELIETGSDVVMAALCRDGERAPTEDELEDMC